MSYFVYAAAVKTDNRHKKNIQTSKFTVEAKAGKGINYTVLKVFLKLLISVKRLILYRTSL